MSERPGNEPSAPGGAPQPRGGLGRAFMILLKIVMWACIGIVVLGVLLFGTCLLLLRH
jgi:hypothetical protein